MVVQVTINILKTMMPEKYEMAPSDLLEPLHAKVDNIVKVPRKIMITKCTYFLPEGKCRGLMSTFLKWANTNSHGATS